MTEEEANNKLRLKEREYFNLIPKNPTQYMAVVKKSNDFEIIDDYLIEIGLKDFSNEYDTPQLFLNKYLKKGIDIDKDMIDDLFKGEIKPIQSAEFELHSSKLTGGKSISYKGSLIKSGSVGAIFKLKDSNKKYLLSNRHVLVNPDNSGCHNEIVSPARSDVSSNIDESLIVGKVVWSSNESDEVLDAAIAEIYERVDVHVEIGKYVNENLLDFKSLGITKIGDNIKKYGKTSGLTFGEVLSANCTVNVSKNISKPKIFRNQILTTNISNNGDSGSCVINQYNEVIGMVVGGNNFTVSFCNNINHIFDKKNGPIYNFFKFI